MEVSDKMWYKELGDLDRFYMNVLALKLLDRITEFCLDLHTADAVDIPQLMKTLFSDTDGIPQFINAVAAVQINSKRAKLTIQDYYMHDMELKFLLKSGEYETETR